jgi:hypothetical protein
MKMTYAEFKIEYLNTFNLMMKYSPKQAGSSVYAEKMAKLSDEYPAFAELVESEF